MSRSEHSRCCAPGKDEALPPLESERADEILALLSKAIAHPIRLQILRLLASKQTCVCGDIVDELPLAQSTVSQHLKVLKEAGLIHGDIDGTSTCYCINPQGLKRLKVLIAAL